MITATLVIGVVGLSAVSGLLLASLLSPNIPVEATNTRVAVISSTVQSTTIATRFATVTLTLVPSSTPSRASVTDVPLETTTPADTATSSAEPDISTPAPTNTSASTEESTYTVQVGDILIDIAEQYGVSVDAIRRRNNLTDDILRVGSELSIPLTETATGETDSGEQMHIVQAGDTLHALALQFEVSIEAIRARNGMTDDALQVGQELIIPTQ